MSYFLFACLLIAIVGQTVCEPELLVPNYDNVEHKLKAFDIRRPLVLHCNITKEGEFELKWKKDGVEVDEVEDLKNRYSIIEAEHKFVIARTEESDAGLYSCGLGDTKKEFNVQATLRVRTPNNVEVSETEDLEIECEVVGTAPRIYWQIGNQKINETTERYKLKSNKNGVKNAIFEIDDVTLEDRREYICVATNLITELEISYEPVSLTFVRVKSRMACVWPAVGILVQVLILGVITIFARKADAKMNYEDQD